MNRFLKKAVALTAALLLLIGALPIVTVFAKDFPNTYVNTGNMAADIVGVAITQNGYCEGSLSGDPDLASTNNYQKYGLWYEQAVDGSYTYSRDAWCACFVSWCANQAGVPSSIVPYHAYCPSGVAWFKNKGLWMASASRGGSYTPKAGDIIYFAPSGSTTASHVGIVRYASGGYVYTAEGNTSGQNGEVNEGGGAFLKQYSLSYERIYGYGVPLYEDNSGTTTAEKLGTYQITASSLNIRMGTSTDYDVVGVVANGDLVVCTELASNGWGKVTLADGTEGWCSITTYGKYIGVDALGYSVTTAYGTPKYSYNSNGSITISNTSSDPAAVNFNLPLSLGTATTPYLVCRIVPASGGYYFGITQATSGYFMMRDCNSGDELVHESSAPFMTGTETLEIDLRNWWLPDEDYRIDTVRMYLKANTTITVDDFYFATEAGLVTDPTYNIHSASMITPNTNLLNPQALSIADKTLAGGYSYNNGVLTVTANSDSGYQVDLDLNESYSPETLKNLLVQLSSTADFNITLLVTTSVGDRRFSLCDDFFPAFEETSAPSYLPAQSASVVLDFLGCYTYNDILPASGESTIKKIEIKLGSKGTLTLSALQMSTGRLVGDFADGVVKSESSDGEADKIELESTVYTVKSNIVSGVGVGTTAASLLSNVNSSYTTTVYDGETAASGETLLKTGMTVKITDGSRDVATYTVAVKGDINCDGRVSTDDVRVLMVSLTGSPLSGIKRTAADFNGNDTVDTTDARTMLASISSAN